MERDPEQYISLSEAANELSVKTSTLHYYIKTLGLRTERFLFDRSAYLKREDFERIKVLKEQAAKRKKDIDPAA